MKRLHILVLAISLAVVCQAAPANKPANALYRHASPYLAMHGQDPVHWHEWNAQTVAKARKQNKLLFVSSGYFSCHWCHVMQRESFQNEAIARLLNTHFIPVKVDRELDSALDSRLIDFVEHTQGIAGWPLNVFVTPEGYPLVGMVYVPPDNFKSVLEKLAGEWQSSSARLQQLARDATRELQTAATTRSEEITPARAAALAKAMLSQSYELADELQGGFGDENKFPSAPQLQTLLTIYRTQPEPRLKQFLQTTLNQMASLGLRDQLQGGFFRYVVDPAWHIPHFEKMLYDNALLASLYLDASVILQEPAYAAVARDTLDFMLRELKTASGALAASLSAVDDQGVEGGYYLWNETDLAKLLSPDELAAVRTFWNISGAPQLDAGHHLIQVQPLDATAAKMNLTAPQLAAQIDAARRKLLTARQSRLLPKDSKRLAAWNGLALAALAKGTRILKQDKYRQAAQAITDDIRRQWWNDKSRTLYRLVENKKPVSSGELEDYAYIAQGLFEFWQITARETDRALLNNILEQAWQRFYTPTGWQLAQDMLLRYGGSEAQIRDSALPSPSAVVMAVSLQYDQSPYREKARQALLTGANDIEAQAFWHATQIGNVLRYK